MRWRRAATIGLTALALLVLAQPASAVTYVGLHDLTCGGATTEGTGMPEGTRLDVQLVDPASDKVLSRGRVVVENGKFVGKAGAGSFLKRNARS